MSRKTEPQAFVGDCRLCGAHGELEDSHIVSRAAYRRALLGPAGEAKQPHLVRVTKDASVPTGKQITEYLLCRGCEERFGGWERYAFPLVSQPDETFPWMAALKPYQVSVFDSSSVDTATLALFAMSLFWRLSVSKEFEPSLGQLEPDVGAYLLGQAPFPAKALLFVSLLANLNGARPRVDRCFMTFAGSAEDGYEVHRFVILGVDMRLFFGPRIPRDYDQLSFARTKRVVVKSSKEFAQEIAPFLAASKPRGRLRSS
jgi:hypothetical protein